MPTYHYVCQKCGHEFEHFQSITEAPLTMCPKAVCPEDRWGRGRVQRQISGGAGLLFKGSGFYTTDYRSEAYQKAAKKETEAVKPKADTGGKTETKSQPAKPASG